MKKDKLNILITAPSLETTKNVSGISSVVQTIINNSVHSYTHFSLGSSDKDKYQKSLHWGISQLKTVYFYYKILQKSSIDIVHLNVPCDTKGILREYIISGITVFLKKNLVIHLHGGEFLMKKPSRKIVSYLFKKILKRGSKIIVLSELERESILKLYNFSGIEVLPNCIEVEKFGYLPFIKKFREKMHILYLGRIVESKGIYDIVNAFEMLYKEIPFKFIVCGDGPQRDDFVKKCEAIMTNDFIYHGVVDGETKINIIKNAHMFILPSRYGEGLPIALLETMCAGLIPIVTDDASIKSVVEDQLNGIIVYKNNPRDIYTKMKYSLQNHSELDKLSLNAHKTVMEYYGAKNYIKHLNDIYQKTLMAKNSNKDSR